MKVGVVFPQTEIGTDPERIRTYARGVEAAGFDHIVAYDHVLGHRPDDPELWASLGPYTDAHPFHEVFVLFSHLSAITSRIEFATEVLVLPQRQTVLVAKQAAQLQLLSGGRLRLGVGVGWNREEFRALGMTFEDRGARVTEQVEILRRLWSDELTSVDGRFHSIIAGSVNPRPPQPIPIWIGGHALVALRRAAAIADGLMLEHSLAEAPTVIEAVREQLAQNRRDPNAFGFAARVHLKEEAVEETVQSARAWKQIGVTHLSVNTMDGGIEDADDHLRVARTFIEAWTLSEQRLARG
ncbi:MAG: LLM class F420-dependent oxidoreductase [Candidatus Dormibacteraceae bacterium]